tara:strand:+ start:62 stop:292 length:231 start_codon:yes stop_codon:yes gene_type:complete
MKIKNILNIIVIIIIIVFISSCRSKKEADCPTFDIEEKIKKEEDKKRSKYKIVILKDGREVGKGAKKKKRKKERMF